MSTLLKACLTARCPLIVLILVSISIVLSPAQSTQTKETPDKSNNSQNQTGFAIESEMLTYTALDSEGGAIACGIARNVGAADGQCTPRVTAGSSAGVVIVSSASSAMAEFQLWRTDISTMNMLTLRTNKYCTQSPKERGLSSSLSSQIFSMIPGGEALSFAQALLTTTAETSPVEGNILDQTLVNDIAGHLKSLGVSVVIPDTYMPQSLAAIDEARSPFMSKFLALIAARECLVPKATEKAGDKEKLINPLTVPGAEQCPPGGEKDKDAQAEDDKRSIAQSIDMFLKSLTMPVASSAPKSEKEGAHAAPPEPTISHLSAVLRADGLAQSLNSTGRPEETGSWYVLWLKALESGGTLLKSGNAILGTKTSYSGGAVGTYALFHLDGNLECSGVFYNYAGPWQTKDIATMLQSAQQPPPGKLVGGCGANQR